MAKARNYYTLVDYPSTDYQSPVVVLDGVPMYHAMDGLAAYAHATGRTVEDLMAEMLAGDLDVWQIELGL